MNEALITALNNRYATKKFDSTKKITEKDLETIIESVRLTPTSYGLQLMKLLVVEDEELRKALVPHAFGQKQIADASHLLILCREKVAKASHVESYIKNIAETRNVPEEKLEGFKNMMLNSVEGMSAENSQVWMDKQVYIALGNLLCACALLNIDACPMEGFKPTEFAKILNLDVQNLSAVVTVPIGYRSAEDMNATFKKVRRSTADFMVKI